jgi:MATE family multidrug resistance protein
MLLACVFFFWPEPLLLAFKNVSPAIMHESRIMLRFVAAYLFFDAFFIIYSNAIKSAGDTRFAMITHTLLAAFSYVIPCLLLFIAYRQPWFGEFFGAASRGWCLWGIWSISVLYVWFCGAAFYLRYRQGRWKNMKVIETPQEIA